MLLMNYFLVQYVWSRGRCEMCVTSEGVRSRVLVELFVIRVARGVVGCAHR